MFVSSLVVLFFFMGSVSAGYGTSLLGRISLLLLYGFQLLLFTKCVGRAINLFIHIPPSLLPFLSAR